MNILMLGGTGYLGSNLVRSLLDEGHELTCVIRPKSRRNYLDELHGVRLIMNDLSEIEAEFQRANYDWVISAVCTYRQNESLYMDMLESNFIFPVKILNLAAKYRVKNFMAMGTSIPDGFSMYSFTKNRLADTGKYFSEHEKLINFIELRLEMFYGSYPGGTDEPESRFIRNSMIKLCRNEPLLLTAGTQKRDIIHVEDVAGLVSGVLNADYHGFRILPAGSGENHPIREIIEFLHRTAGSSSRLEFGAVPQRAGEPDTLSNTGWYSEIGYTLKHTFFGGLETECLKVKQSINEAAQ